MMRTALALLVVAAALPAGARDVDPAQTAQRVDTLEAQMRAVQRKVFTGGDPKFFTPDIAPAAAPAPAVEGTPASAPLNDLTARVDALERQLRTLTGAVEEGQNSARQTREALAKLRGDVEFRLNALEHVGPVPAATAATPGAPAALPAPSGPASGRGAAAPTARPGPPAQAAQASDPVETAFRAAYARFTAKDYPGAEAAFTEFLAANPKSTRASNAQYWLGRSYAAQNSTAQAAKAYLDGYQKYPKSDHAADSLIGLSAALTTLKKPDQACRVLTELQSVYGSALTAPQEVQTARARTAAKCPA